MAFPSEIKSRVLLWSDRHCCLCKKACGTNIEVHHIEPEGKGGSNDIDNAMPLCFDCHSDVIAYNDDHPRGNKYKPAELKARREQVYEEFTRHLVPPINFEITQNIRGTGHSRKFPDVGFNVTHLGDSLPVRVQVVIESILGNRKRTIDSEHYSGKKLWNLNPRHMFYGHFQVTDDLIPDHGKIELRVTVTVVDQYSREHLLLPLGYVYVEDGNYWYAEP